MLSKTDIYATVLALYQLCPSDCRKEIGIFARNCLFCAEPGAVRIMLDGGLVEILADMLKEEPEKVS